MDITELLTLGVNSKASDLHLSAGLPPLIRVDGDLVRLNFPTLDRETVSHLLYGIMEDTQKRELEDFSETDFSFEINELARFRANVFKQNRGIAGAFRMIPTKIATLNDLDMPTVLRELCHLPRGLILITGPTGSGKSTTLAAMLDYMNESRHSHILTIEDPIEFIHPCKKAMVNQREVYRDTRSFETALRSALREDPDVILVGELRDLETIRLALTAAETGHLVLGTLHTSSAAKTIHRIIDVFSNDEKAAVRSMLSESLQAVISQSLLKKIGGGRVAALEIMLCTLAIRNLIREDKIAQMYSVIQTSSALGMKTSDQSLKFLVDNHLITRETAQEIAVNREMFI